MREINKGLLAPVVSRKKKKIAKEKTVFTVQVCQRAISMLQKGSSIKNMVRDLQFSENFIRRIKQEWDETGTLNTNQVLRKKKQQPQWKIDDMIATKSAILEVVRSNCALTLGGMKQALTKHGINKPTHVINKYLKELRYSRKKLRKVPIQRNTKEKLIYRQKYCNMVSQIPLQNLVFLDQTSFNQHTSLYYGWAPKGEQPAVHIPAHRKQSVSLLAAISIKGFEATKIIRGPITNKHICQFLEHYLDHLQPHQILILDNARVHHAAAVKAKITQLARPVRYLPAYTPQLNPIQNIFSEIKGQFMKRRNHAQMSIIQIENLIEQSVKNITSKSFHKQYDHYAQWVKKGQAGQLFI